MSTREPFDPDVVRREMQVIREDLHCNAVRITGGDPDRMEIAATHAAAAGLEVWLSPFTCELTADEMFALLADCAERAERLRRQGAEVVLLTGSELSLFNIGFLPGETCFERLEVLTAPHPRLRELLAEIPGRINDFLGKAVQIVREQFGGKVSYASLPFEGVDTAFANTFASYQLPHRDDPRMDLDVAGYGVVKVLEDRLGDTYPGMPWEPKAAFIALAACYRGAVEQETAD